MKKKTLNSSSTNINNNIYENENEQENQFNEEPLYKHLYLLLLQIFNEHKLNYHSNKEEREKEFKYYCNYCDYGTFAISFIEKHNNTKKHKRHLNIK